MFGLSLTAASATIHSSIRIPLWLLLLTTQHRTTAVIPRTMKRIEKANTKGTRLAIVECGGFVLAAAVARYGCEI